MDHFSLSGFRKAMLRIAFQLPLLISRLDPKQTIIFGLCYSKKVKAKA
jgi:hypothetical protein